MRPLFYLVCTVFLLGGASCVDEEGANEVSTRLTDSRAGPRWDVQIVRRIGSADDPAESLTTVGDVLIGPEGELIVSQPDEERILIFPPDGARALTVGQRGEGPGEFNRLSCINLKGDTLYASDSGLGRVTVFSRQGKLLRTQQLSTKTRSEQTGSVMTDYLATPPQVFLTDGTMLLQVRTSMSAPTLPGATVRLDQPKRVPFVRLNNRSEVVDTVAWKVEQSRRLSVPLGAGTVFWFSVPFRNQQFATLMRDGSGVVSVESDAASTNDEPTFTVTLISAVGDTTSSRAFTYRPVRMSQPALDLAAEEIQASARDSNRLPTASDIIDILRDNGPIPRTLPPVTALVTGQDGSIWLRRESTGETSVVWTILKPDGSLAGSVALPRGQMVAAANGSTVAVVELDELDVPYIVVYALETRG